MGSAPRQFCMECGHLGVLHDNKTGKCTWKDCKCAELIMSITAQEMIVLKSLAIGKNCKVVAKEMNLSVKTIEAHKYNFMHKLKLHNRVEVILFGLKQGIVKFEDLPEFRAARLEQSQLRLPIDNWSVGT